MKYDSVLIEAWKHVANDVNNNWFKFERDIFIGLGVTAFFMLDLPIF